MQNIFFKDICNEIKIATLLVLNWLILIHYLLQVIDTQTKLYLVLELGDGGDMYDYIMKHEGGLGKSCNEDS